MEQNIYQDIYVCPQCGQRAPRDNWSMNPRQGTIRCPHCEKRGLDIIPDSLAELAAEYAAMLNHLAAGQAHCQEDRHERKT